MVTLLLQLSQDFCYKQFFSWQYIRLKKIISYDKFIWTQEHIYYGYYAGNNKEP
jgi:hypothetical protein